MSHSVVIAGYKRTPFHLASKGSLVRVRPDKLAAIAIRALVDESGVDPKLLEDVIIGCAFPEGEQGFNIGRLASMLAGLPYEVAGLTVNRFCGSSMQSAHIAAGAIAMGAGEAFICAGVESMSRIPMGGFSPSPNPELHEMEPGAYCSMGETAENVAKKYQINRLRQEEFAVASHAKASSAQAKGNFKDEIVAVGDVSADGCIRPETTLEKLATLAPAFDAAGVVTAGTSSPLTDGAAAVLVTSEAFAKAHGLKIMAKIRSMAVAGCDPTIMGIGPVPASQKALARAGVKAKDLSLTELNEAFASQALATIGELGLDPAKVNLDGGAIALGHPLGATGARILGKAASLLVREKGELALVTQCIGGGQGIATVLEAV